MDIIFNQVLSVLIIDYPEIPQRVRLLEYDGDRIVSVVLKLPWGGLEKDFRITLHYGSDGKIDYFRNDSKRDSYFKLLYDANNQLHLIERITDKVTEQQFYFQKADAANVRILGLNHKNDGLPYRLIYDLEFGSEQKIKKIQHFFEEDNEEDYYRYEQTFNYQSNLLVEVLTEEEDEYDKEVIKETYTYDKQGRLIKNLWTSSKKHEEYRLKTYDYPDDDFVVKKKYIERELISEKAYSFGGELYYWQIYFGLKINSPAIYSKRMYEQTNRFELYGLVEKQWKLLCYRISDKKKKTLHVYLPNDELQIIATNISRRTDNPIHYSWQDAKGEPIEIKKHPLAICLHLLKGLRDDFDYVTPYLKKGASLM